MLAKPRLSLMRCDDQSDFVPPTLQHEEEKTRHRLYHIQTMSRRRFFTALTRDPRTWNATKRGPKVITDSTVIGPSFQGWWVECLPDVASLRPCANCAAVDLT
ncbi:hypothetical protein P3342_010804 [Pyrenophora teres f. teres]|nr:hypothetical protein P3342_010804 [Pyrenophora teres f. teres]